MHLHHFDLNLNENSDKTLSKSLLITSGTSLTSNEKITHGLESELIDKMNENKLKMPKFINILSFRLRELI